MDTKILNVKIVLVLMLVTMFVLLWPPWVSAKNAKVRVAILPPVSEPFMRQMSYRIRQFPRELTDLSDNAVYEALMTLRQKYASKIEVIPNYDADIVPGFNSPDLKTLYLKISNRDTSYFNKKYREDGKKNGRPRVNLLFAWQLDCGPDEIVPDHLIPFVLHCYVFSKQTDPESKTGVVFKRRKNVELNPADSAQTSEIIQDKVLTIIEQFIQSEELDVKREWGAH